MNSERKAPITVVVLNYNGRDTLSRCLDALLGQTLPIESILVFDNASTDGSSQEVRRRYPNVRVVRSSVNLGFAGGNNAAMEHVKTDWVALLNNDAFPAQTWIEILWSEVQGPNPPVALSSLVRNQGAPKTWYRKGGTLNLAGRNIREAFDNNEACFFPTGCACLLDKKACMPLFDEDYFMYGEDVALGWRLRLEGKKIRQVSRAMVFHLQGSSSSRVNRTSRDTMQERNRVLNCLLFFGPGALLKVWPLWKLDAIHRLLVDGLLGSRSVRGMLQGWIWPVFHMPEVMRKRRAIQEKRRVSDQDILKAMSGKLTNSPGRAGTLLNRISLSYCRLMGLGVLELQQNRQTEEEAQSWLDLYQEIPTGKGRVFFPGSASRRVKERRDAVLSLIQSPTGQRWVDLGCDGAPYASSLLSRGLYWVGVDSNLSMLLQGKKMLRREKDRGFLLAGDALSLPLRQGVAQGVLAVGLLNLIPRTRRPHLWREIQRILVPGGRLVLSNLCWDPLTWIRSRLPLCFPWPLRIPGPVYPATKTSLLREMREMGFKEVKAIRLKKYLGLPYCWVMEMVKEDA